MHKYKVDKNKMGGENKENMDKVDENKVDKVR